MRPDAYTQKSGDTSEVGHGMKSHKLVGSPKDTSAGNDGGKDAGVTSLPVFGKYGFNKFVH